LEAGKVFATLLPFRFLAHAYPNVGIYGCGAGDRL
jgi:hypothetical protein